MEVEAIFKSNLRFVRRRHVLVDNKLRYHGSYTVSMNSICKVCLRACLGCPYLTELCELFSLRLFRNVFCENTFAGNIFLYLDESF